MCQRVEIAVPQASLLRLSFAFGRKRVGDTELTNALDRESHLGLLSRSRSEEHTSELQSLRHLVCRLLLEKKKRVPLIQVRVVVGGENELPQEEGLPADHDGRT